MGCARRATRCGTRGAGRWSPSPRRSARRVAGVGKCREEWQRGGRAPAMVDTHPRVCLARSLESHGEYKRMVDHADIPPQRDLDGRGNLSRWALAEFTAWFQNICLDQVTFMTGRVARDTLLDCLHLYTGRRAWRPEAWLLLAAQDRGAARRRSPHHRPPRNATPAISWRCSS